MTPNTTIKPVHALTPIAKNPHSTKHIISLFQHRFFKHDSKLTALREKNQHLKLQRCRYKALYTCFFRKFTQIKAQSQLKISTLARINKRLERHVSRLQRLSIQLLRYRSQLQQQLSQQRIRIQNMQHTVTTQSRELAQAVSRYDRITSEHRLCKAELKKRNQSVLQLTKWNLRLRIGIAVLISINLVLLTALLY
ncbi:hypothetical protein CWC18_20140 [Pseudoalteromonas aurantia]|uniref:hypothetical protein n=1 Tax=Pseudoalteromonas aurantia TaxID=43654 RepID=UPI00110A0C8E|nr:hypothetical protein [Pseudoalteromonas aurantia]TMO55600.1 hypothetical protein CWC18_20140 [Pseudoalteromonas aurantia]